jgi:hypothetical protein
MWVPIVEQELLTFLEHTSSPAQPLVFYVMFCRSMFVFLSFIFRPLYCLSFDGRLLITPWYLQIFLLHCVVCPSMDDFWLPVSIFKSFFYIVLPVLRWTTFDYPLGQTIQCNRKVWRYQGVIKSRPLKKDRQYNVKERFEDTKG